MQTTKLIVFPETFRNITVEGHDHLWNLVIWNTHRVNEILVQRNNTSTQTRLRKIDNLRRNENFEIIIEQSWTQTKLQLSKDIIDWLIAYLQDPNNNVYHCTQFGRFLFKERPPFWKTRLNVREVSLGKIRTWDMVIMKDTWSCIHSDSNWETYWYAHVAIYLWNWWYISKIWWWGNDKIIISSYEKLQEIYPYDEIKVFRNKDTSKLTNFLNLLMTK